MTVLLGRPLRPAEHVHHRDGNTLNNHPANLQLLSHAHHSALSNARYPLLGFCAHCGQPMLLRW